MINAGRFDEALAETRRALELDPLSPFFRVGAVWPLYFGRRYDQAIEELRKIVAWNPEFVNGYFNLGQAYTQKEMYEEAIAALNKAKSIDNSPMVSAFLGYAYARAGKHNEARQALAELQAPASGEHISNYALAVVYAGLGERDQAFAWLQKTYDARDDYALMLKVEPVFDGLRSDPRFRDLLRRMNLSP